MKLGYLLIDGNNIGFAATAMKALTVGDFPTQGIYGVLRSMRHMVATFPMLTPIVLWDGVSWRYQHFTEYKAKRDKPPEKKYEQVMADLRIAWRKQKPVINKGLELLGVPQMIAMNWEADDLAGLLVDKYSAAGKKILLVSGDEDWIQLVGPKTSWIDPINDKRVTLATIQEKLGVATPQAWLEHKCLTGDTSDEIPGVGGIGEKGAKELLKTYGSVAALTNKVFGTEAEIKALPKKFASFIDDSEKQAKFRRNMMLMDLRSKERPAPLGIQLTKGKLNPEHFTTYCTKLSFLSILKDLDGWVEPFRRITE